MNPFNPSTFLSAVRQPGVGLALVGMTWPTLLTLVYFALLGDAPGWLQQSVYAVGKAAQFVLPLCALALLPYRPWRVAQAPFRVWVLATAFTGAALLVGVWGFYGWMLPSPLSASLASVVKLKLEKTGVSSPAAFVGLSTFYSLIHSFLEEYYWRGGVLQLLQKWWSPTAAIGISAVAFALHHVVVLAVYFGWDSPVTYLLSVAVAVGGGVWGWTFARTGSVLPGWASHACVDALIFWFGFELLT